MRPHNKIIGSEFKVKLKELVANYPSQSIKLNDFLSLLISNNIRLYSRAELTKVTKFFDNVLKIAKITVPLSYMQLQCVQENNKRKSFIVKVSARMQNSFFLDSAQNSHQPSKCLENLTKILASLHGSQKNWFKVLGGMTISVRIQKKVFKSQVQKFLKNTIHVNCGEKLTNLFTENNQTKEIEWQTFMKIIQKNSLSSSSPRKTMRHIRCKTADLHETLRSSNKSSNKVGKTEGVDLQEMTVADKTSNSYSRTGYFWSQIEKDRQYQIKNWMSIESKQCQIYSRQKSVGVSIRRSLYSSTKSKTEPIIF